MNNNETQNVISVATKLAPKLDMYSLMINGTVLQVFDPDLIRFFSQIFRIPYRVLIPTDGEFGVKLPNGNWSGMLGLVEKGEVDLAVGSIAITEERFKSFKFSYPYLFSDVTFMTDKLEPLSNSSILLLPFSLTSWIFLLMFMLSVSFLLLIVSSKKQTYNDVLFKVFGSVMGHVVRIKSEKSYMRLILGLWLVFIFIIMIIYRALLLSVLSFPPLTGITNTADLTRATEKNLIKCYNYKGSIYSQILLKSDLKSWKSVGHCIQRSASSSDVRKARNVEDAFFKASPKKAFIGSRYNLIYYERDYFISEDSFFNVMVAFPTSRNFCCLEYLNKIVHRFYAAGIFQKLRYDEKVLREMKREISDPKDLGIPKTLKISDFKVVFVVLIFGHLLASVVFFIEIMVKYLFSYKNTIIHQSEKNVQRSRCKNYVQIERIVTQF